MDRKGRQRCSARRMQAVERVKQRDCCVQGIDVLPGGCRWNGQTGKTAAQEEING